MILVTGSSGFLGRNVVKALRTRGESVRCLVRSPSRAGVVTSYGVELAYGDILDPPSLKNAMKGVDAVAHLVAIIREKGRSTFDLINRPGRGERCGRGARRGRAARRPRQRHRGAGEPGLPVPELQVAGRAGGDQGRRGLHHHPSPPFCLAPATSSSTPWQEL